MSNNITLPLDEIGVALASAMEEYVTIEEAAKRKKISATTLQDFMKLNRFYAKAKLPADPEFKRHHPRAKYMTSLALLSQADKEWGEYAASR